MADRPPPFADLDWSPERARSFGDRAVEIWVRLLEKLPELPVDRGLTEKEVHDAVALAIPDGPMPQDELFAHVEELLFDYSMYPGHPGFMAYISGSGTIPGTAADLLASAVNQNLGGWRLAPGPTEIELHLTRWFGSRFGLPSTSGGLMTSGGAMANFIGLKAARDDRLGYEVRDGGVSSSGRVALYASEEVHSVSDRAVDMLGLGSRSLRKVPTDDDFRMDMDALNAAIDRDLAEGVRPIAVVATAGTVATGAIDPLEAIADLCDRHDLWMHVDGAYGGPAVLAEDLRPLFAGIERADSIAFDPHKWLYTPQSGGCVVLRDLQDLADSFSVHATYVHQDKERTGRGLDYGMLGPQFSRGFQAFKVWISLLAHGLDAYGKRISHDARLARYLGDRVEEREHFELMAPIPLSICCFRYVPDDVPPGDREGYLDTLNERVMTEIQLDGRTYYSNAVLHDRFVLRACIVNFRTEAEHLDLLLDVTEELGERIHEELKETWVPS